MSDITSYCGLSPLAGICSFEDVLVLTALSVEQCVSWMKRHHYLLVRLHEIFTARITAEPVYELKTAFSLHAYICGEHASAYRKRVSELREPPLGLDAIPHEGLKLLCDEVLCSPTNIELVLGLYEVIVPRLIASQKQYPSTTNLLADAPSVCFRFCILELEDLVRFGRSAIQCLVDDSLCVSVLRIGCICSAIVGIRPMSTRMRTLLSAVRPWIHPSTRCRVLSTR